MSYGPSLWSEFQCGAMSYFLPIQIFVANAAAWVAPLILELSKSEVGSSVLSGFVYKLLGREVALLAMSTVPPLGGCETLQPLDDSSPFTDRSVTELREVRERRIAELEQYRDELRRQGRLQDSWR